MRSTLYLLVSIWNENTNTQDIRLECCSGQKSTHKHIQAKYFPGSLYTSNEISFRLFDRKINERKRERKELWNAQSENPCDGDFTDVSTFSFLIFDAISTIRTNYWIALKPYSKITALKICNAKIDFDTNKLKKNRSASVCTIVKIVHTQK